MTLGEVESGFLSRMSHELRTPLNSIIGFAQLLKMNDLGDTQREYVDRILSSGRRLLALIDEILDISRLEAGTLGISRVAVDADAALEHALGLIRPMADDRGLTIHGHAAAVEPRYVTADEQRLRQILLNLLSHTVKYNREGGKITASIQERGERLRILVADTGSGLSREQAKRLFVPFERTGGSGGDQEDSGLGLALSKRLAELMGGSLEVHSELGTGSEFVLELLRTQAPEAAEAPGPAVSQPAAAADDRRATVLYIEDNLLNVRLVQEVLALRPQVTLLSATQGRVGLELAAKHRPDLLLLDVHLPDISGSEVLARVRSHPALAEIPVVVLSADATEGQIKRLLAAGAQTYLTKPLDIPRFLEAVDDYLGTRG